MYSNPPPEVAAMKAMLEASATWVAMTGTIHYPSVSSGDSASADAPPHIVIEPSKNTPRVMAPSVVLPGGTIQVVLTLLNSAGADIEKKARAIGDEVVALPTGLPLTGYDVGMASEPTALERAAQEYSDENSLAQANALIIIPIIFTYGLT